MGNKKPTLDKLIQLIGIKLLFQVDLSDSKDMLGKKHARKDAVERLEGTHY